MASPQGRSASSKPDSDSNPYVIKSKHPDFKKVEATRPAFETSAPVAISQTANPAWIYGAGAADGKISIPHLEIDPFAPGRTMFSNYKLIISGIVPRPIGFLSTRSADGKMANLAPFSYFQAVDHDPPIFVIGFSARAAGDKSRPKDTLRNLRETGECVINVVSEHMIEAVNATSLDVPYGVSEWELSGLHEAPSTTVKASRVKESIFSIEGKLLEVKDLDYGHEADGKVHGSLAIIKASRFWVREDAINKGRDQIDLQVLRPVAQLGGISYGRVREIFELPRSSCAVEMDKKNGLEKFVGEEARERGKGEGAA